MGKILLVISILFLVSCSNSEYVRYPICQKVDIEGGYTLDCYGMDPITIKNGVDGNDGEMGPSGPPGTSPDMQLVQLCPGDTATFPEQGIKNGNKLYAVFHNPPNTFLALITPGTYVTTNGSNCKFRVNEDGTTQSITNSSNPVISSSCVGGTQIVEVESKIEGPTKFKVEVQGTVNSAWSDGYTTVAGNPFYIKDMSQTSLGKGFDLTQTATIKFQPCNENYTVLEEGH